MTGNFLSSSGACRVSNKSWQRCCD